MYQAKVLWEVKVRGITDNTLLRWMEQHIQASGPVMDIHFRRFLSGLCVTKGLGTARLHNFLTAPILPSLYLFSPHRQTFPTIPTFPDTDADGGGLVHEQNQVAPESQFQGLPNVHNVPFERDLLARDCHSNLSPEFQRQRTRSNAGMPQ
jgi:hypothetical protein